MSIRLFLQSLAWSVPFAALAMALVSVSATGYLIMVMLGPVVLTGVALRRLPSWMPQNIEAAFLVTVVYAWALDIVMAACWGFLLDFAAQLVSGSWGAIMWGGPHGGGQISAALVVPSAHAMFGWTFGLVAAIVHSVVRSPAPKP